MRNFNKIGIAVGLVVLVVLLVPVLPKLHFHWFLSAFSHAFPWVLFALFWILFSRSGGCCRSRCGRGRHRQEDQVV